MATEPGPDPSHTRLSTELFARLIAHGVAQEVRVGDVVFRPGDPSYDLIVIESGSIDILTTATHGDPEAIVARYDAGGFLGELNLLTGRSVELTARVTKAGRIHRISAPQFHRLIARDPALTETLLRVFLARRDELRRRSAEHEFEIIGSELSPATLTLRTYAARLGLQHLWLDADKLAGRALSRLLPLAPADLPAIVSRGRVLPRATPGQLDDLLGRPHRPSEAPVVDLCIVGSGPAGLAAALHAASQGLDTTLLDSVGVGGNAAAIPRIGTHLGVPADLDVRELMQRAAHQAVQLGAIRTKPGRAIALETTREHLRLHLAGGTSLDARAVLVATGAAYRTLPLPRWTEFETAGIYYAATLAEARACDSLPVTVIGRTDAAGRAALYLASQRIPVTLAVSADDATEMSPYILDRVESDPKVRLLLGVEVIGLAGTARLEAVDIHHRSANTTTQLDCRGLFCMLGASPATAWLRQQPALDHDHFILTDGQLAATIVLDPIWRALDRRPLPFETSVPGVFAAGDVRAGSTKRVASAAAEGTNSVTSIQAAIGR